MTLIDYFTKYYSLTVISLIIPLLTTPWLLKFIPLPKDLENYKYFNPTVTKSVQFLFKTSILVPFVAVIFLIVSLYDCLFSKKPFIPPLIFQATMGLYLYICSVYIFFSFYAFLERRLNKFWKNFLQRSVYINVITPSSALGRRYAEILLPIFLLYRRFLDAIRTIVLISFVVFSLGIFYGAAPIWAINNFKASSDVYSKMGDFQAKLKKYHYIAYNPTNYNPTVCDPRPVKFPPRATVIKDLLALKNVGFTGLLTFSALDPESVKDYIPPILYSEEFDNLGLSEDQKNILQNKYYTYSTNHGYYISRENINPEERRALINLFKDKFIGLSEIPAIAKEFGFKSIILGLWNVETGMSPSNSLYNKFARLEMSKAISKSVQKNVDAYCIGHNQLNKDYGINDLRKAIEYLRKKTGKPVSTTQPVMDYYTNSELYDLSDWFCPDIHGYWYTAVGVESQIKDSVALANVISKDAGNEILSSVKQLQDQFLNKIEYKPVLVKFIGFPSAGKERFSELTQEIFFREFILNIQKNTIFSSSNIAFSYFDAFDTPWKGDVNYPEEAHTGFFTTDRKEKPAAKVFQSFCKSPI